MKNIKRTSSALPSLFHKYFQPLIMSCLLFFLLWDVLWSLSYSAGTKTLYSNICDFFIPICFLILSLMISLFRHKRWFFSIVFGYLWLVFLCVYHNSDPFSLSLKRFLLLSSIVITTPSLINTKRFFSLLRFVVIVLVLYHDFICLLGIYASLTNIQIPNLSYSMFLRIIDSRLSLFFHPVSTGSHLCLCILLAIIGYTCSNKKCEKLFFIFSMILLFGSLSLTNSRGPIISCGIAVSFGICTYFHMSEQKRFIRRISRICLFILSLFLVIFLSAQFVTLFNYSRHVLFQSDVPIISYASAEENLNLIESNDIVDETVAFRTSYNSMEARYVVWKAAYALIKDNPNVLIWGTGLSSAKSKINAYVENGTKYSHVHNMWLQTVVHMGIPGLLCLLSFQFFLFKACRRIITHKKSTKWMKLLPMVPLAFFIGEMVDCMSLITSTNSSLTWCMMICGFIFAVDDQLKKMDSNSDNCMDNLAPTINP